MGRLLFRVWIEEPLACAELYKRGEWVWTSIPSGSISSCRDLEEPRVERDREPSIAV